MAVYFKQNPYNGINAHYQSFLQNTYDGWRPFHSSHIVHLKEHINRNLPEGYYAVEEQSLQVQAANLAKTHTTRPIVSIYSTGASSSFAPATATAIIDPTFEIDTEETFPPIDDDVAAVTVYHIMEHRRDKAVTTFELFSPSNKNIPEDYFPVRSRRLAEGVRLVEIDYLHESPNLFSRVMPDYSQGEENAYPYMIVVTDPMTRESPNSKTRFYAFHVDEPIPTLDIPLLGEDSVVVNFGEVYNYTYINDRRAHLKINYAEPPIRLEAYSSADQEHIQKRMAVISNETLSD